MSTSRKSFMALMVSIIVLLTFSSCYSVRWINKDGIPEADPLNNRHGFYNLKKMRSLDTTVSLKFVQGDFSLIAKECKSGCFYSFEYRVTFGGLLLNAVTLGRKKRIKVIYVCQKESN
ncbi:MAG TPA: hypothetical protein VI461_17375 [Chitinophagaceae bacterium]|nr:hypothetical protein [Chitinophagaceae bacterium]